jgi:hypothetical protein
LLQCTCIVRLCVHASSCHCNISRIDASYALFTTCHYRRDKLLECMPLRALCTSEGARITRSCIIVVSSSIIFVQWPTSKPLHESANVTIILCDLLFINVDCYCNQHLTTFIFYRSLYYVMHVFLCNIENYRTIVSMIYALTVHCRTWTTLYSCANWLFACAANPSHVYTGPVSPGYKHIDAAIRRTSAQVRHSAM